MSDRVAVFNDGVVQQLAPPDELYERPVNSFVAQFIGENNKLHGRIEEIGDGRALVRLDTGELIDATPVNVSDLYRTRLRVAGSDDFVIKSRNTLTQRRLQPGERIKIGWAPQDARALDA